MQRRTIQPFNPKATIALLKEDPKVGSELSEADKRVLIDRYLEVRNFNFSNFTTIDKFFPFF